MSDLKKHVVFLGLSGFPIGMAAIQRQKLLAKGLINEGWRVTIVCTRSTHESERKIRRLGICEGIIYIYIYTPFRNKNFVIRNVQKLFAPVLEFFLLIKLNKRNNIKIGIVSNRNSFIDGFKYFIFSKLVNFKLIINLVEIYKDRPNTPFISRCNDYLFNKYGLYFFNAFLPISNTIINYFKDFGKRYYHIPVIVNSQAFSGINCDSPQHPFFVFCGSASYLKSLAFIIESFSLLKHDTCQLILVTNGSKSELDYIAEQIKKKKMEQRIFIRKNLSDEELYTLYKSANGLLLPLFDTIQDKARFPHKLAEYLASGNVVLSNPVGEILNYLQDNVNVLFSKVNDVMEYASKMEWVLNNKEAAKMIGTNGIVLANDRFDYKKLGAGLNMFLID